jgi:hypothetical protein
MFPVRPIQVSGPNVKLNPNVNNIKLRIANPKKICMKIDTVFFRRNNPASNNPNAGIINNTRLEAISIQAVSPVSIGKISILEKTQYKKICFLFRCYRSKMLP